MRGLHERISQTPKQTECCWLILALPAVRARMMRPLVLQWRKQQQCYNKSGAIAMSKQRDWCQDEFSDSMLRADWDVVLCDCGRPAKLCPSKLLPSTGKIVPVQWRCDQQFSCQCDFVQL